MNARILFVDDEVDLLRGLRNRLCRQRRRWTMEFSAGGDAALEQLAHAPFDVLVTDMRMPGVNGFKLLEHAKSNHPSMVRVILSGQTDKASQVRTMMLAHVFLNKPCEGQRLIQVIERILEVQSMFNDERLQYEVGRLNNLPIEDSLYTQLSSVVGTQAPTRTFAAIIEKDVAMTGYVLRMVNSAFFGLATPLRALHEAVMYLGCDTVLALVLAQQAFQHLHPPHSNFPLTELQQHALCVSRLAAAIVDVPEQRQSAGLAGMLHDIGWLVLAVSEASWPEKDHARIGAYLLGLWGLPWPIVEAVAYHHAPSATVFQHAESGLGILGAVHVADALVTDCLPWRLEKPSLDLEWLEAHGLSSKLDTWRRLAAEYALDLQESTHGNPSR